MKIYIDLVFLLNFCYDFLLLVTVNNILKRKAKLYKLLLSSLIGSLSLILLFIDICSYFILLLKLITSILMVLVSFKYVSIKYTITNLSFLYMSSIILAGFLYFLDINFSFANNDYLFIFKGFSVNYLLLLLIGPIILLWYILLNKKLKCTINNYYQIDIYFDDKKISCLSLFDNGNSLKDPITNKSIIIVNDNLLKEIYNIRSPIYVPYKTISNEGVMRCYKPSYIIINNQKIYNYLIGETTRKFSDGVQCLLNNKLMEDNYV